MRHLGLDHSNLAKFVKCSVSIPDYPLQPGSGVTSHGSIAIVPTLEDQAQYHRLVCGASDGSGSYRKQAITVKDRVFRRPAHGLVAPLMSKLDGRLIESQATLDKAPAPDSVIRVATMVHQRIAFIHPFNDGNGRVARLAMNHLLRRYGIGYSILPPLNESERHMTALESAHGGDLSGLEAFILKNLVRV